MPRLVAVLFLPLLAGLVGSSPVLAEFCVVCVGPFPVPPAPDNPFPVAFPCPEGTNETYNNRGQTTYACQTPDHAPGCTVGTGSNGLPVNTTFCYVATPIGSSNAVASAAQSSAASNYLLRRVVTAPAATVSIAAGIVGTSGQVSHVSSPLASDQDISIADSATLHVNSQLSALRLTAGGGTALRGSGSVAAATTIAANAALYPGNSPGTLRFTAPVTLHPGSLLVLDTDGTGTGNGGGNYSRVMVQGASFVAMGGIVVPVLRGLTQSGLAGGTPPTNSYTPPLGQRFAGVVSADGGIVGGFEGLVQPASGLAPGTRFDTLYRTNTIDLVVTPAAYGNLAAAGLWQRGSQAALGTALDAVRPAAGTLPMGGTKQVFDQLYTLSPGALPWALDQLSPMIYADAAMAGRLSWNAMEGTVTRRMAATRGQPVAPALVWVDALSAYGGVRAGAGSPGATSGLGGVVAGYDRAPDPTWRVGAAIGAGGGRVWSQTGSRAGLGAGQLTAYAQWQQAGWFTEAQAGLLYQQATPTRPMPGFGVTAQGNQSGFGGGGMLRGGYRFDHEGWQVEPSAGFGGMALHAGSQTETGAGPLSLRTQGQTLGSIRTVLAVAARRAFAIGEGTELKLRADLGWAHEYAATRATVGASFTGLPGSDFTESSAPVGRDAALIGLSADLRVPGMPLPMFAAYQGGFANGASMQSLTAGVRLAW